jgi:predicted dehydrogenase
MSCRSQCAPRKGAPWPGIRIGIVGAGANTRLRHIPGFRASDGVEIVGVVNRSPESTRRAAAEFGIPRTFSDWRSLVAARDIDAVMIGTWPNLHCEVTCAALAAGKHVLTEARMARNVAEAEQMLAAAQAHPDLVAQIVPSPFGLECGPTVERLLAEGAVGDLRELVVIGADEALYDDSQPVHWRQDAEISGVNVLTLGILHETALRWVPAPTRVFAQSSRHSGRRGSDRNPDDRPTVPDSVHVLTELPGGAQGLYHFSGIALFGPGKQIHLYGSRGTIKVEFGTRERAFFGRAGAHELAEVTIPLEERGRWRVEEEFIGAIRGQEPVRLTDFATGLRYMQFTEAVAQSAGTARAVALARG